VCEDANVTVFAEVNHGNYSREVAGS